LETEVELMELKEKTTLSREEAAAGLHAIADELASNNDVVIEREDLKFVAHVPDQVHLQVEFRPRPVGMRIVAGHDVPSELPCLPVEGGDQAPALTPLRSAVSDHLLYVPQPCRPCAWPRRSSIRVLHRRARADDQACVQIVGARVATATDHTP
jgi:amphi-Trp domain-containing protein